MDQDAGRTVTLNADNVDEVVDAMFDGVCDDEEESGPMAEVLAAAEAGDATRLAALLDEHGLDVNTQGADNDTPLHIGCLYGHFAVVMLCITRGAEVVACDEDGSTPLHDASAGGYYDIARVLLQRGAKVDAVDNDGDSPLHLASNGGHAHVVDLLLNHAGEALAATMRGVRNANGELPADLAEDPSLVARLRIGGEGGGSDDDEAAGAAYKRRA